jgi:hypothetical protein
MSRSIHRPEDAEILGKPPETRKHAGNGKPPRKRKTDAAAQRVRREDEYKQKQAAKAAARQKTRAAAAFRIAAGGSARQGYLTPALAEKVLEYVLAGNYLDVAAQAVGVHRTTLRNWQTRAEEWVDSPIEDVPENERIYVDFHHAMKIAEAQAEVSLLKRVAQGNFGWQAAMYILERRHPDRWRRRDTVEHQGGDPTKPIRTVEIRSDDERAKEVAGILTAAEAVRSGNGDSAGRSENGHG